MFDAETIARIPDWKARKQAQWERIKDSLHGLQLATSGEQATQFMLTCSPHDASFYESILMGQLPQVMWKVEGSPVRPTRRLLGNDEKPIDKREIDLSDDQIDQVIARWREGQSAFDLPFVMRAWGADGRVRSK